MLEANARRAIKGKDAVILAVPSTAVPATMEDITGVFADESTILVCAAKGFEPNSTTLLPDYLQRACPDNPLVMLSGPTFAIEVAKGLPSGVVAASRDADAATAVQQLFEGSNVRVYTSSDVTGVALGERLENVVALATGCCDGLGFGSNARAALITRGLHEMALLAEKMGADPMTLSGLAGLGDLMLTCTGDLSRNRTVGLALGRGNRLKRLPRGWARLQKV